ncbi:MAG: LysR family transcriptional regulator [Vicingaceae bacterium]
MNYTFHQLRIFQTINKTGSITRAAEQLNLTQPAVSIQLKNLQDQFEIPLTEVIGRKIYITDFGKQLAETANRILEEAESLRHITMAHKGHLTGKISMVTASTAKYVMPYFLANFINDNPGIELDIDVTNKQKVIELLEANQVDFAMVSVLPNKMLVDRIPLLPNKLYMVGHRPLPKDKKQLNHSDLDNLPLIFREKGSASRLAMEEFISENQLNASKRLVLSSNEAVKQAVIAGLGYSLLSLNGIKNELKNGDLYIIPMNKLPIVNEWNLIWLKNKKFSPAAKAYLEYLKVNKEKIIEQEFEWFQHYGN